MDAQEQPLGPRVFWTIGFLALGTLSAIGASALFPWYLAIAIAILVAGLASACAFQFRETKNYLYLIAMLAMTSLAAFLDGVSVWEILNKRQNSQHHGVLAEQQVIESELQKAQELVDAKREEIASLTEEAQNMDNDGRIENDRLIPGMLAKIESKKADLPNYEDKVKRLREQVVAAASSSAESDAGRHVLLQMADEHESAARWLILRASIVFLIPELTLALLAWSLRGAHRGSQQPQPVVIVPHGSSHPGHPDAANAYQLVPQMAYAHPSGGGGPAPSHAIPVHPPAPRAPHAESHGYPEPATERPHPAPSMNAGQPAPSGSDEPMGMGQMMMNAATRSHAASPGTERQEAVSPRETSASQGSPETHPSDDPVSRSAEPQAPAETTASREEAGTISNGPDEPEEDVVLSPDSVPEMAGTSAPERRGSSPTRPNGQPGKANSSAKRSSGSAKRRDPDRAVGSGGNGNSGQQPFADESVSVMEAAKSREPVKARKSSPTKAAKSAAAKRSRKGRRRGANKALADIAAELN